MEQLSLEDEAALQRFTDFHNQMLRQYNSLSAPAFVERLINRSGLLKYVLIPRAKNHAAAGPEGFYGFCKGRSCS
ncbi:MAG: hypothetical protein H6558_03135 [Lewinellaceae bacterium]|nr:hypothetical protein [Lewinellaceae bacterium]